LKRRTLPKPAASATCAIGRSPSWIRALASSTRRVCATLTGAAPRCFRNSRRSCRSPTPSRPAKASTSPSSSAPASIRASARDTVFEVPFHAPISGAVSGRQRRQARKPRSSAAAAVGTKITFCLNGVRAGHTGRQ
jgi:hypothetical protein